jgi:hypothetical protein
LVDHIFSDGLGSIAIIGGTVRLDFMVFSPTEKEANGQPKVVHQQRIVMGAEAFLHSTAKIQEAAQALSKLGTPARPSGEPRVVESSASPSATGQSSSATPPKRPFP